MTILGLTLTSLIFLTQDMTVINDYESEDFNKRFNFLKNDKWEDNAENILWIFKKGKTGISHLIKEIDNETLCLFEIQHPTSSYWMKPNNQCGILAAWIIELILSNEKLELNYVTDLGPTISYKCYPYLTGMIFKKEKNGYISANDSKDSLKSISSIYMEWWEKNKQKSISDLRNEWHEGNRPLNGSNYIWR